MFEPLTFLGAKLLRAMQHHACVCCQQPVFQPALAVATCTPRLCSGCLQQLGAKPGLHRSSGLPQSADAAFTISAGRFELLAATGFNAHIKAMLYGHKFGHKRLCAKQLTELLLWAWQQVHEQVHEIENAATIVVTTIPAHMSKQRQTQSPHAVAKGFSACAGLCYSSGLLLWQRQTQPQHTLQKRQHRWANMQEGLRANVKVLEQKGLLHRPKAWVVVVDDLTTSGATLHEAAQAFFREPAFEGRVLGLALTTVPLGFTHS